MNPNVKPSSRAVVLGVINPQSATTVKTTGATWIDMSLYESVEFIVLLGALTSSATVDAKIQQATSAAGAGAKDITGKAATQLTQAGTDDNKQVRINVKSENLDVANGFRYIQASITPAVAAALIAGVLLGWDARYGGTQATTVDEIVG